MEYSKDKGISADYADFRRFFLFLLMHYIFMALKSS